MDSNFTMDTLRKTMAAVRSSELVVPQPPVFYSTPMAQERVQWRYPRSKKKRIRAKWAKRERNVRYEPRIYCSGNAYYCHPTLYNRLRSEIPEAPRASTLWHNDQAHRSA